MKKVLKTEVNVNSFENTIYFAVILSSKKKEEGTGFKSVPKTS